MKKFKYLKLAILFFLCLLLIFLVYYIFMHDKRSEKELYTKYEIIDIGVAIDSFKKKSGQYPEKLEDLVKGEKYIYAIYPIKDGWGNLVVYKKSISGSPPFMLYSYGEDGVDNGGEGDDINYWNVYKPEK